MKIDFATLAFNYTVNSKGATPNWTTNLGQSAPEYKINDDIKKPGMTDILKGMIYASVPVASAKITLGKTRTEWSGADVNTPIVSAALFKEVYINDIKLHNTAFILMICRDMSESHKGRLQFKYSPHNKIVQDDITYTNHDFYNEVHRQFGLASDACWYVSDITVKEQNELHLTAVFVNKNGPMEYSNSEALHNAWEDLESEEVYTEDVTGADNILYYGVPGSGKSHAIKKIVKDSKMIERVVFHPDYTYSDFVGQILPVVEKTESGEERLRYRFVQGPFTRMLKKAKDNADKMCYLVIEEINRGNAPAIFGEIFQLLDRNENGASEYSISNSEIAEAVYGDKEHAISIPANLTIYATMNTSDQNVFTLDTAFQRRWKMKQVTNDVDKAKHANIAIEGTTVTWSVFADTINEIIVESNKDMLSSEDKRLGAYFLNVDELSGDIFPEKALKYLWDDAFKMSRADVFKPELTTLEKVIQTYKDSKDDKLSSVLRLEAYQKMLSAMKTKEENISETMEEN